MNYKVLYRKYRPDNFESIIGQDYINRTLKNSILNNNISHAYIFSGPRGTGKTTTAKVFSKAINCLNPIDGSPCGKCEFCLNFHENPDIIEIDAASNNGVDEIRNLIDNIKLTPTNGRYKVYIIDEVHMLTTSAFNALLLTLEEPPAHSIFILATTNIENVPITILSRCQRFDFQKINADKMVKGLKEICKLENIEIDDAALNEIAYLSEGAMRDALSLLDQLSKNDKKITLDLIENQIKTISQKSINDLLTCIEDNDIQKCIELVNEFRIRAVDYKVLIKKIIENASKKAKNIKINGRKERLSFEDYKNLINDLSESISKININIDSYTILEMILLEYFEINNNLKNIDNNENKLEEKSKKTSDTAKIDVTLKKDDNISEELINIRINNCFVNVQKKYLEEIKKEMEKYTTSINLEGKIKSIMVDSSVVAASDKNLIFTCQNKHNVTAANKMLVEIEKSLKKEINRDYKIIFITFDRWNEEKEKYIENSKNKKLYSYIEEQVEPQEDENEINDVFDLSKVEII